MCFIMPMRSHNQTAVALREVGRVERTLFITEWILDTDMQRRAQIGLNKGEAHHALKTPCALDAKGKSAIEPRKVSITGSPG